MSGHEHSVADLPPAIRPRRVDWRLRTDAAAGRQRAAGGHSEVLGRPWEAAG